MMEALKCPNCGGNIDRCVAYHPLDNKKFRITYVHSGLGMEKDYVVFGIREIKKGK